MTDKSSTASYALAGWSAIFGTLTVQEWAALGGLALGSLTLGANVTFKLLHYRLAQKKTRAELAAREVSE